VTISNHPETTPCISGGGFLLERFREFFYSAAERAPSITGGSICSVSDYLFQLRDFELAFEELSMTSTSGVQTDQLTGSIFVYRYIFITTFNINFYHVRLYSGCV
jgi:hypothetical protein